MPIAKIKWRKGQKTVRSKFKFYGALPNDLSLYFICHNNNNSSIIFKNIAFSKIINYGIEIHVYGFIEKIFLIPKIKVLIIFF